MTEKQIVDVLREFFKLSPRNRAVIEMRLSQAHLEKIAWENIAQAMEYSNHTGAINAYKRAIKRIKESL